jgi:hypothetical protein
MQAWRRWCVSGLVAVVVSGHLYALAVDRELWPFSQYPMYARAAHEWTVLVPRLVGVQRDGREMDLVDTAYLQPFDQARLMQALGGLEQQPNGRVQVTKALADCLSRYERRRNEGAHDGPELGALRLYHVLWTMPPETRNLATPERRDLVLEVTQP